MTTRERKTKELGKDGEGTGLRNKTIANLPIKVSKY